MSDTIAAIATAPGPSAIGILRLSGPEALSAASAVFRSASGRPLESYQDRVLVFGELLGPDGRPIDQVLATVSRSLHSYTGEDTAELHCHGSPAVLALGLEALFAQGVRQAGPGEFTRPYRRGNPRRRLSGRRAAHRGTEPPGHGDLRRFGGCSGPFPCGAGLPG